MTARATLAYVGLLFHATVQPAQAAAQGDKVPNVVAPTPHSRPLISGKTVALTGLLFGAALLGDGSVRQEVQEHRGATTNSLAKIGKTLGEWQFLVPTISAGLLAGQLSGSRDLKRVMLHAGAATVLATGVTTGLKYSIGRTRPGSGDPDQFRPFSGSNSFPSGHTAAAFALATSIADQTGDSWSDVILYSAATLTALSRVNDDRHWTSDVLIGALIGHLSGRWVARRMTAVRVAPGAVAVDLPF
ncbi:MAG TPA: phosphatase PAP2 family protein [Gemmatimonadales bacterium]|jgi:membrane-associated phospholipid phosphatase